MAHPPFKLGTRRSPLAMAQAREVRARLVASHEFEESAIALVPVTASGDRIQDRPLAEIGGKALWTKELDAWLLTGEIDFAVHSAKDVETIRPDVIVIAAVLEREDVRDVLIGAQSIAALAQGAIVGTSAPRRAAQLLHARPDCAVIPIRGNVATRLAKLAAGEVDATFLAAAGLKRLGETGIGHALPAGEWLPAPGQAAILVECRAQDEEIRSLLAAIDDPASRHAVIAERALLAALGGDCHSPVAVLTEADGDALIMRAALFCPDGTARVDGELRFAPGDSAAPARLARSLLDRAAPAISACFSAPQQAPT
jgi:hydroxymethylbilane synthase